MHTFRRRLYAVVNPEAALGRTSRFWPKLQQQLRDRIGPFSWDCTESSMHATSLARTALEQGYDLIVSVGGDGTHNEVINGFFTDDVSLVDPGATLSVVPCGSGNDLCRSLGISSSIASVLETILCGRERQVDVGRLQFSGPTGSACERLFVNIASSGLSARVGGNLGRGPSFLAGPGLFFLATIRTLIKNRKDRISLEIDGKVFSEQLISTVAVANGQFFGGGMRIAPHARLGDGLLDVVVVGAMSFLDFICWARRFYQGRHIAHPRIQYHRARTILAKSNGAVPVEVDGETVGSLPAGFSVLPRAVRILVPA